MRRLDYPEHVAGGNGLGDMRQVDGNLLLRDAQGLGDFAPVIGPLLQKGHDLLTKGSPTPGSYRLLASQKITPLMHGRKVRMQVR